MFQPCSPPPLEGTPGSPPLWLEGTGLELLGAICSYLDQLGPIWRYLELF